MYDDLREDIRELKEDVKKIRIEDIPEIQVTIASLKTRVSIFSAFSGAIAGVLTVLGAILIRLL